MKLRRVDQERWFGEYQSVGERPLREDERADILREVEKFRALTKWLGIAVVLGLLCWVVGFGLSPFIGTWGVWLIIPGTIAILYGSLNARDAKRAAAFFQSELDAGKVEQFEIPLDNRPMPGFEIENARPVKPMIWRFEAFSPTGRLVRVPDDPKGELVLDIRGVAQTPTKSERSAFPTKLIVESSVSQSVASVRTLTSAEVNEINAFRDRFSPRHCQFAVLAFLYCSFGAVFLPFQINEDLQLRVGGSMAYGVIAALIWFFNRTKIWNFVQLRKDTRQAEAYVVPLEHEIYRLEGIRGTVEYLPNSKFVWTIDGEPAWWRKG